MPISLSTVGWVDGRTATLRWPEDFPASLAGGSADRIGIEYRGLTAGEQLYMADVMAAVMTSRQNGASPDPLHGAHGLGLTRYLAELFRVGVVAIRGLTARGEDGATVPHTPAKALEDGFLKLSLELVVALRREYPGLVEVVANRIFEASGVTHVEKKASLPASGPARFGSDSTAEDARESSGRVLDAGTSPPTSVPPCLPE